MYGANASGKSNIIQSFGFLKAFVGTSARDGRSGEPIRVTPFVLDSYTPFAPSKFEVVVIIGGIQYRYGFSVNASKVVNELLYYCPTIREVELFSRDEDGIHLGPRFREGRGLADKTRKNALFLSVVAQFNGIIASKVVNCLYEECNAVNSATDDSYLSYTLKCIEDGKYREAIGDLVSRLDLDILRLSVAVVPPPSAPGLSDVQRLAATIVGTPGSTHKVLQTRHAIRDEDGTSVGDYTFPMAAESDGTKKLIALAGPIVDTLANGRVLFVDEIDARIHPLITTALLQLFNSQDTNPKGAQLICATHDTNLLDRRHLRRDQIYFVEKDRTAATRLFSLADFKLERPKGGGRSVRNDASFERDYIQGRYGAIPYVGELPMLFSEEHVGT